MTRALPDVLHVLEPKLALGHGLDVLVFDSYGASLMVHMCRITPQESHTVSILWKQSGKLDTYML